MRYDAWTGRSSILIGLDQGTTGGGSLVKGGLLEVNACVSLLSATSVWRVKGGKVWLTLN